MSCPRQCHTCAQEETIAVFMSTFLFHTGETKRNPAARDKMERGDGKKDRCTGDVSFLCLMQCYTYRNLDCLAIFPLSSTVQFGVGMVQFATVGSHRECVSTAR